jgi:FAD/FMN-containing dehydrogenase
MGITQTHPPITSSLTVDEVNELKALMPEKVFLPADPEYASLSQPFNLSVKQSPTLLVAVHSADDIVSAVHFARKTGLGLALQGGAHGVVIPADGALLINTRQMKAIQVDVEKQTARIEAGAKWGEVLQQTQAVGLAPLLGSSPDVGVAGYTLGGGMGWLARKYGLSLDNVLSFELVTTSGEKLRASQQENSDLFWGLRGGGGSLAIVTSLEIRLYPLTSVYAGNLYYPVEDTRAVFTRFREWVKSAPDELTSAVVVMNFPPMPAVPEFLRGKSFVILRGCYAGSMPAGEELLKYWREWRSPLIDDFKVLPFSQAAAISNDPVDPIPSSSTGAWLRELSDEAIDVLVGHTPASQGSPITVTEIRHAGGAISRVDPQATAFGNREAEFSLQMIGITATPQMTVNFEAYTSRVKEALAGSLTGGVYPNFLEGEEAARRIREGYSSATFQRLIELKAKFDPHNLLRYSYQIPPANSKG